jgi:hypothetical protein
MLIVNTACARNDLTYSDEYFSENTYKYKNNKEILLFQELPKTNEYKGVLKNGGLFSVKYWSGDHSGVHAIMLIGPQIKTIPDELSSKIIQLAKLSLFEPELGLLIGAINKRNTKLSKSPNIINIDSSEYSEFYISFSVVRESILIEIKMYRG